VFAGIFRRVGRSRTVHHQAGARHDPALVRLDDPSIDAAAEPEIVGVDDEQSQRCQDSHYAELVQVDQEAPSRGRSTTAFGGQAAVRALLRSLARSIDLLRALTESDLRFRYGRGPFRFARWLLEPVALVGIYLILVTFVLNRPGTAPGLSLACAVIPFQLVMLTIANSMTTLDARRPILLNMAFRRMLLPISAALTESVAFASSLLLLIAMMAIYDVAPTWNILWFPLVLFVNLLLAIAAAYGAILFGIWLRELRAFVTSFVRTLFFLAPGLVPLAETREDVRDLLRLNPLTGLFEAYRDVFMNGTRPELWELVFPVIAALVLLAIFVPLYRSEQRQFAKVI
jgi:ABC-type polysaccharide/polyol phosphate export permease